MPAAHAEIANELVIHSHEHGVPFNRKDDVDLCLDLQTIRELACHTVGMVRVPQPKVIRQKCEPLYCPWCGNEWGFGHTPDCPDPPDSVADEDAPPWLFCHISGVPVGRPTRRETSGTDAVGNREIPQLVSRMCRQYGS